MSDIIIKFSFTKDFQVFHVNFKIWELSAGTGAQIT